MWEWVTPTEEQAVMFYWAEGPLGSLPPMSDQDWDRLEESNRRRSA